MCCMILLMIIMSQSHAANILLAPLPFKSHTHTMISVGQSLSDDGHDVTLLLADTFQQLAEGQKMTCWFFAASQWEEVSSLLKNNIVPRMAKGETVFANVEMFNEMTRVVTDMCEQIITDQTLQNKIKSKQFDLMITEGYLFFSCINILPYNLGIPFIVITVQPTPWLAGVPSIPSFEPSPMWTFTPDMSIMDRFMNVLAYVTFLYGFENTDTVARLAKDKSVTSLMDVSRKAEMWLVNTEHRCLDYPRTSAPNFQFVGSTSIKPPKPLPDDLERFVSSAQHGVIVASFGSSEFRAAMKIQIEKFFKAFQMVKQKIVLALDCDGLDVPANVKCMSWMPQNDLLGHQNCVLFISHGGAFGQMEAIGHGVPILSIGVITEQIYDSNRIEYHGYGKRLVLHEFTSDDLVRTIHDITTNRTYYDNTKRCAQMIRDFPPASENVVFWVNHILKFGGSHLRPKSLDMTLPQMFMLDVLGLLLLIIGVSLLIGYCTCCFIIQKCCYSRVNRIKSKVE